MRDLTFAFTVKFNGPARADRTAPVQRVETDVDPSGFTAAEYGVALVAVGTALAELIREAGGQPGVLAEELRFGFEAALKLATRPGGGGLGDDIAGRIGPTDARS